MTNHESTSEQSNIPGKAEKPVQLTPQESGVPHQPDFSLVRVLFMVLILCGVGAGGWYLLIRESKPPALVPYTGRVLYQGKPVVGGVMTQNLDDKFDSAGGTLDADGRFTLDTNGEPGANAGRHKLAIISFESRGAPPRPLVPADYTTISSTPLIIEVTGDPAANHKEFTLEGSAPEPSAPREASPPGPGSPPGPPGDNAPSEPEKPPAP